MFSLNETNRFYVYTHGIDMRKGVESLCGIVRNNCMNPLSGSVFLFANKSRSLLKLLHWERGGFVIYYKRLESGRVAPNLFRGCNLSFKEMRWDEIVMLMGWIRYILFIQYQGYVMNINRGNKNPKPHKRKSVQLIELHAFAYCLLCVYLSALLNLLKTKQY